jgi:hypothetical protein
MRLRKTDNMTVMNEHRGLGWVLACALAGCAAADASPTDGGAPAAKQSGAKKSAGATPKDDEGGIGLGGIGVGVRQGGTGSGGAYPECMSAADAEQKGTLPSGERVGRTGGRPGPPRHSTELTDCPVSIWTYVGAGHGSVPVGNVQAPLGSAATRKERKKRPHNCCYMIPPAPGRPNG